MKTIAGIVRNLPVHTMPGAAPIASTSLCRPDCPICGGLGRVRLVVPLDHPNFGKLSLCPNVSLARLPHADCYGLEPGELASLNWENVLDIGDTFKAVTAVQEALKRGCGWVYLYGQYGLGKTLVMKTAIAETLRQCEAAAYTRLASVLDNLRSAHDTANPSWENEQRLDWWSDLPVLAIDELDRLRHTEYTSERRFLLFDRRYEQALRRQSVTLMAANVPPSELDGYLADRIQDGRFDVVCLNGESARPGMDWQMAY